MLGQTAAQFARGQGVKVTRIGKTAMLKKIVLILFLIHSHATLSSEIITVTGSYDINGQNLPDLTLVRGVTYEFNISVSSIHPFWIKTVASTGTGNSYNDGITNNGIFSGTLTFSVPKSAPDALYYNCQTHSFMTGSINIIDAYPIDSQYKGLQINEKSE